MWGYHMDYQCTQAEEIERQREYERLEIEREKSMQEFTDTFKEFLERLNIQRKEEEKLIFEEAASQEEEKRIAKEKEAAELESNCKIQECLNIKEKSIPQASILLVRCTVAVRGGRHSGGGWTNQSMTRGTGVCQSEQEELTIEEKSKLFVQLLEERKKHFVSKRAEEKRNRPPTKAQQRSIMCTYLKNMAGWKPKDLKNKSFANIQEIFDKAMKRVNTFVNMDTELVEGSEVRAKGSETREESSSKRVGDELEHEKAKKQKVDEDK
ncbi:hypothetical protein Tco_0581947 [Tanacetum coccineum]